MSILSQLGAFVKQKLQEVVDNITNGVTIAGNASKLEGNTLNSVIQKSKLGFKNIIINGDMRVNQRAFGGVWSAISDGSYGYDRWKKSGVNIVQIIESINYKPNTIYTLSGTNITTQQLTSPSSGNWTITVPNTATNVQLEEGSVATTFELRHIAFELELCKRYYEEVVAITHDSANSAPYRSVSFAQKRVQPTVSVVPSNGSGAVYVSSGTSPYNLAYQTVNNSTMSIAVLKISAEL